MEKQNNRPMEELLVQARKINAERDASDRKAGFSAPPDCGSRLYLSTAIAAIYCGLATNNLANTAEGLVMLQDIEAKLDV